MPLYRVFAGAPSVHDVLDELNYGPTSHSKHNWTVHSVDLGEPQEARIVIPETQPATPQRISRLTMHPAERQRLDNQASLLIENDDSMISGDSGDLDVILPEATFIEASNRLTMLCNGLEFGDDEADEDGMERLIEDSRERTTSSAVSWEDTQPESYADDFHPAPNASGMDNRRSMGDTSRMAAYRSAGNNSSCAETQPETFEDEESGVDETTEGDSIGRFPTWHFSLHRLSQLDNLLKFKANRKERRAVTVLAAVLDVEGPAMITTRAGLEMGLLKVIIGDETGAVAKITVWRETALQWGEDESGRGINALKKGDVTLFENLIILWQPDAKPTLTASPTDRAKMTICFRTLPTSSDDRRHRPDLRLGASDAAIRKVAALVEWVEAVANIRQVIH